MIKAHEVYRFDGIPFSEKACRESEVRELEKKLDDAQNERDDQTVSVMKLIVKSAKMEVENKSIKKQLDMAIEVMKEVLEETGNRSLALYLAKHKDNQDGV